MSRERVMIMHGACFLIMIYFGSERVIRQVLINQIVG